MAEEEARADAVAWTNDAGLANEVRDQFERAISSYRANPNLILEHANHEESIRVGGYANRTLLELVQNAADAMSGVSSLPGNEQGSGRVEIVLDVPNKTLYCANSGRPFSRTGFISIAHAHLSGKRGDEIGRFGLGFKSVLAVSRSPQVFSRSVSFEFNSPTAIEAITGIGSGSKRIPILRTATLVDAGPEFDHDPVLADLAEWAVTVVKLPAAMNLDRLRGEIEDFSSEFLLFVGSVRMVKLRVIAEDGYETSHILRDLGNGVLKIERPDGNGDEWIVVERMHEPSTKARQEVGEAVSREKVKVTVALPVRQAQRRVGEFWSYFRLQDSTSASALFNAPWSVNDDRTTLLRNDYNREILRTMAEMFVSTVGRISSADDPAAHLDYLPARGREERSFGDTVLCALVPSLSAEIALIPDALGALRNAQALRPLDFSIDIDETIHHAWINSPNTGNDVPHWRAYTSKQRVTRLRELFAIGTNQDVTDGEGRDMKRALALVPKRGLLSWIREWAEGDDAISTANAFKFVLGNRGLPEITQAKVIPTTDGLRSLADRSMVFLEQEEDIDIDGAVFIAPWFLAQPKIKSLLLEAGFRNLDPVAILTARLISLSATSGEEELTRFWDAVVDVSVRDAIQVIRAHPRAAVKVPTHHGEWAWPQQVFDIGVQLAGYESLTLDRQKCLPDVAYALGVVRGPVKNYHFDDEPLKQEYTAWVIQTLNDRLGPGERPIERISLYPKNGLSPGPFSLLPILANSDAPDKLRTEWTYGLLAQGDSAWDCEDVDSGANYSVCSPVRWAVDRAGRVESRQGVRGVDEVVSPALIRYRDLLPLFTGPAAVAAALELPDSLESVSTSTMSTALAAEFLPPAMDDDILTEFILEAGRRAYPNSVPPKIPARIGRAIESRPPKSVFIAVTDEQRDFLRSRQRPYLQTTEERAAQLIDVIGCQRFEDTFSFSMVIEGEQVSEHLLDVFSGLRYETVATRLTNSRIARAARVTKRVTTDAGVEDQSIEWYLDGLKLVVQNDVDDQDVLPIVNQAFDLRLNNAELQGVRKAGLDDRLEELRLQAVAASTDAERLEIYFGEDDLREALPKGLWRALRSQGLVDQSTSVGELYLTVYGSDSVKQLGELFKVEGFTDFPTTWAGGAMTISWLRRMGFGAKYAGRRIQHEDAEFVVPGAIQLSNLHPFQQNISGKLREVLTTRDENDRAMKAMVELPTGAGKTRVASETVLRLFTEDELRGVVLWIAQSQELCEQAVQTWSMVWRGLGDERPLTIGRLWDRNEVHEPDTEFSVIVATDAKLDKILDRQEYAWLSDPAVVIIDEGHRAGDSELYTRILSWLGVAGRGWARPLVGLSATPFKGTSEDATRQLAARFGGRKLRAFESNPYKELAEQGVLARVRHQVLEGVEVRLSAKEREEATTTRRINPAVLERIGQDQARLKILVEHIMDLDPDWPVLVFTPNVLSAQVLAATLRYRGIEAASVSGQTGRQERRDVIQRFKQNKIRVLTNCDLLIQGFDAPGVRALYIARPTFSPNAYIQMAGRGLRGPANGGKEECLIVDMADNFGDINSLLGFRAYEDLWQEQHA
ncbi:DEAD/DEAH box helicase family protein [Nocardia yamanashiensis]|uniref:sacsin N-terminal ATP-binding-like domain-containing protein n=1 Tax=Nocardia yamanashiensis TaxID=209247 RepID=UPI001E50A875|nr:DEAD/DEAH box helicase family protein [Nocardia yamanashiensis]UGT42006.1 DEAD/DEAH box helicase family protein [Nocardia yamanashiensis]